MIEAFRTGDNQAFATLIKVTPHLNFFSKGTCYYGKEAPYVPQVGIWGPPSFFRDLLFKKEEDEKHRYLVLIFHLFQVACNI